MAERMAKGTPSGRERKAQSNPVLQFGSDLLAADARASRAKGKDKDGKYGPRPSERALGSLIMMVFGVGVEPLIDAFAEDQAQKRNFNLDDVPSWVQEAGKDMVAGIAYAVIRKNLDQLPSLKIQDFGVTVAMDIGAAGFDNAARGAMGNQNSLVASVRKSIGWVIGLAGQDKKENVRNALANPKVSKVVDHVNPLTVGALREGLSAGSDLWSAYRDVVAGVPEKAEEKKEPVTKETTIIFLGNDQQLASALSTVSGEGIS